MGRFQAMLLVLVCGSLGLHAAERVNNGVEEDLPPLPPLPVVPTTPPNTPNTTPVPVTSAPVAVTPVAPISPVAPVAPVPVPTPKDPPKLNPAIAKLDGEPLAPPAPEPAVLPAPRMASIVVEPPPPPPKIAALKPIPAEPKGDFSASGVEVATPSAIADREQGTTIRVGATPRAPIGVPVAGPSAVIPAVPVSMLDAGTDLIGDRPGVALERKRGPFYVEMDDFTPPEGVGPEAAKTYKLVAELKQDIYQLSVDLDAGGVEKTRLSYNSDKLSTALGDLARLWLDRTSFRDKCLAAKRTSLVLNEELNNEPRVWSHVRWSFRETQRQVLDLRKAAIQLADAEPRLQYGKDGKPLPDERDPLAASREEAERRRKAALAEKDRMKARHDDARKDPLMDLKKYNETK